MFITVQLVAESMSIMVMLLLFLMSVKCCLYLSVIKKLKSGDDNIHFMIYSYGSFLYCLSINECVNQ